jgi:RHS repeat-associated protein
VTASATPTATPTVTATDTATDTASATDTPTETSTDTPTAAPSDTATATPTLSDTPLYTQTPTTTPTGTLTATTTPQAAIQLVAYVQPRQPAKVLQADTPTLTNTPTPSNTPAVTPDVTPTATVSGSSPDTTITYKYDGLYRVLGATYTSDNATVRSYSYTYDLMGNRLTAQTFDGTTTTNNTSLYNLANQLVSSQTNSGPSRSYSYDPNGNMTSDGLNSYAYDAANRLKSYTDGTSSAVTNYLYDGVGHRVSQTTGSHTTTYLYDVTGNQAQLLGQTTDGLETRYLVGGGGVIGQQQNNTWSYFGYDGLGSVRQLTDASGALRYSANYDPYGVPFYQAGDMNTSLGFAGEPTDPNGLQFLTARYYNPASGDFLTHDPVYGSPTSALSQNGYIYVEDNPTTWVDPTGLEGCLPDPYTDECDIPVAPEVDNAWQSVQESLQKFFQQLGEAVQSLPTGPSTKAEPSCRQMVFGPNCLGSGDIFPNVNPQPHPSAVATPPSEPKSAQESGTLPTNITGPQPSICDSLNPGQEPEPQQSDVFDVALGRGETLESFAASFTDRPTKYWMEWPDWMLQDSKGNWLRIAVPGLAYSSFVIAINTWNIRVPNGKIKFNLEGLDETRGITLKELRYILDENIILKGKTQFYSYGSGVAEALTGPKLEAELKRLRVYFKDLY